AGPARSTTIRFCRFCWPPTHVAARDRDQHRGRVRAQPDDGRDLGWDPQLYSGGRFNLGLGTQVQAHIEKRFSMPWSHPVRRMREFVDALQAIWTAWQDGSRLALEGEFYTHRLMTPMFTRNPCRTGSPRCSSLQSARR
ncbi:MAG: hypothetical protein QOI25_1389, partial [Mycobacterium sp.]|nr:hypothetical protein [Mycobacterium sp.]